MIQRHDVGVWVCLAQLKLQARVVASQKRQSAMMYYTGIVHLFRVPAANRLISALLPESQSYPPAQQVYLQKVS